MEVILWRAWLVGKCSLPYLLLHEYLFPGVILTRDAFISHSKTSAGAWKYNKATCRVDLKLLNYASPDSQTDKELEFPFFSNVSWWSIDGINVVAQQLTGWTFCKVWYMHVTHLISCLYGNDNLLCGTGREKRKRGEYCIVIIDFDYLPLIKFPVGYQ